MTSGKGGQEEGSKEDGAAGVRSMGEGALGRGKAPLSPLEGPTSQVSHWARAPAHLYTMFDSISAELFLGLSVRCSSSFSIITS